MITRDEPSHKLIINRFAVLQGSLYHEHPTLTDIRPEPLQTTQKEK